MSYYDKDGKPMELMEWAKKFKDLKYRIIAQDKVNGYRISTVWMGLDHQFGNGPPLIFETMAFQEDEKYQDRYTTLEEALQGHQKAIRLAELQPAGSVMDLQPVDLDQLP